MDMYIPLAVKEVRLAQHFYDRITYESVDTKPNGHSIFHLDDIFKATGCTHDDLIRICDKLQNEGLVDFFNDGRLGFVVRINEEKTKSWLAERKQDNNFNKAELNDNNFQIFLNSDGDLYRDSKDKFNYAMGKEGWPIKIVKFFADNTDTNYIPTQKIADSLDQVSSRIRTDISKINGRFKASLGFKGRQYNLIISRQGNGYKLNPMFQIIQK